MLDADDLANREYDRKQERHTRSRTQWEYKNAIENRVCKYKLKQDIEKSRKGIKMSDFAKGIKVKVQETKYGEIIKLGINKDEFLQNPFNERGWVNIDILTSKEGKKYAKINDYKATNEDNSEVDTEEIPF